MTFPKPIVISMFLNLTSRSRSCATFCFAVYRRESMLSLQFLVFPWSYFFLLMSRHFPYHCNLQVWSRYLNTQGADTLRVLFSSNSSVGQNHIRKRVLHGPDLSKKLRKMPRWDSLLRPSRGRHSVKRICQWLSELF